MSLEVAITGKPSSGKSSFFKAATMIDVDISSRPFTTIKPNTGIAYVIVDCIEKQFRVKCKPNKGKCVDSKRYIPIKLWDIAGIVPDAHTGKGLGLKFLDDIRQASALIQVVDISGTTDEEGNPTANYDPVNEVEFVREEIDSWFEEIIRRGIEKYERMKRTTKVDIIEVLTDQLTGLQTPKEAIRKVYERVGVDDVKRFASELRKLSKPIIIAANKVDLQKGLENIGKIEGAIPTSAAAEIALRSAEQRGLIEYDDIKVKDPSKLDNRQIEGLEMIKKNVVERFGSTGIQKCLNTTVFDVLDYVVVYPVSDASKLADSKGNILPDACLVRKGSKLKEFAYMIHTDIGNKFMGGMDAKTKRKLGADYELKNDDVVEILTSR